MMEKSCDAVAFGPGSSIAEAGPDCWMPATTRACATSFARDALATQLASVKADD